MCSSDLDFGIAKSTGRIQSTQDGQVKGKFAYMPPEQLHGDELDRRADVYAAGVVLWEALAGARLFLGSAEMPDLQRLLDADVEPPSSRVPDLPPAFDAVTMKALRRAPDDRFASAREMALAIEACGPMAPASEVSAWVERWATRLQPIAAFPARALSWIAAVLAWPIHAVLLVLFGLVAAAALSTDAENFTADSILNFSGRTSAAAPASYCMRKEVSVVHSRIPKSVFPV